MKNKVALFARLAMTITMTMMLTWAGSVSAADVSLKTTLVRGNIYMIEGVDGFAGGNVAVSVGPDGLLVVDSLLAELTEQLTAQLATIDKGKLRYVLNTHWHGDHTGGNIKLSTQAPIIAHDNVRKRLQHEQQRRNGIAPAKPPASWPVLTFSEAMTVHFNNETIQLKHYPASHTDGDSVIYFVKANVLHMGDNFFNGHFPFVDLLTGGSVTGLTEGIAKILTEMPADVMIIPGHGKLANLADLKAYQHMLTTTIATVETAMKAGQSLAQIQATGFDSAFERFDGGFIDEKTWIETIYQDLKQQSTKQPIKQTHLPSEGIHRHH